MVRPPGAPLKLCVTEPWFHFFLSAPLNFFCAGILKLALGAALGMVEGVVVWPWTFFCAGILKLALGAALGMVECVVCGAVGWVLGVWGGSWGRGVGGVAEVGAGSRGGGGWRGGTGRRGGGCWGLRRGWLVGWYGAPWGWVLGAVLGAVEGVVWGAVGVGAGSRGGPS